MISQRYSTFLSIVSGLILVTLFPRLDWSILAWGALVPFFFAIQEKSLTNVFWQGMALGVAFYFFGLQWVTNTLINFGHLPVALSYGVLALLAAYLSFYLALFACVTIRLSRGNDYLFFLLAPFVWTALEYFRSTFTPLSFSWLGLGYSQYDMSAVIQIAEFTGVYGVSWLIVYVNAAIFYILREKQKSHSVVKFSCTAALIPAVCLVYGFFALNALHDEEAGQGTELRIALAQGNISQDRKWNPTFRREIINTYQDLTLEIAESQPDLVVWPEAATPFYFGFDEVETLRMQKLARKANVALVFGSPYGETIDGKSTLFNSAYFMSREGEILGRYDKMHLVPFGEYVPFRTVLFFVEKMVETIGHFGEGKEAKVFHLNNQGFGISICYEIIFPDLIRQFANNGAHFLVNITNDAWFGKSSAPFQHMSMAVLRAVENRIPIVRSANTGISGAIDRDGRILKTTAIFEKNIILTTIRTHQRPPTYYTSYGDVFSWMCIAIVFALGFMTRNKYKTEI